MSHELYKKYRPTLFKHVFGQGAAIKTLQGLLKKEMPHSLLFSGPTGVGKTTLARIVSTKIGCAGSDYKEVNCADDRGIGTMRSIVSRMRLYPMRGKDCSRMWVFDEFQAATGDAQTLMLKPLEDTPSHVYFVICTTDPQKVKEAIRGRCTEIKLRALSKTDLENVIGRVLTAEKCKVSDDVLAKLVDVAAGSARKAVVLLESALGVADAGGSEAEVIDAIRSGDSRTQAIEIFRALIDSRTRWDDMAKILRGIENEPEEGLRRMVLSCCDTLLLGKKSKPTERTASRALLIIDAFREPWFECGRSGLTSACYLLVMRDKK